MSLPPSLRSFVVACLVSSVAWWTTLFVWRASPHWAHSPLALALASLAGFGLVGWIWGGRATASALLARFPPRDLLLVLLLAPAWFVGLGLERVVGSLIGANGAAPAPLFFEWSPAFGTQALAAAPLLSVLAFVFIAPLAEEWLYRGVMLPRLVAASGPWRGLVMTSAVSAVAFVGVQRSGADWLTAFAAALAWALLLGLIRLATGSWLASALLRALLGAAWVAATLAPASALAAPSSGLLLAATIFAVAGIVLACRKRWPPMAQDAGRPEIADASAQPPRAARFTWPSIGLAIGAGVLVGECVVVLRGLLDSFAGGGIALDLALSLLLYCGVGAALDLGVQALLPARLRGRAWALVLRALPALVVAFIALRTLGLFAIAAFAVVPVAALFAGAWQIRWARPLAAAMALATAMFALPPKSAPPTAIADASPRAGAPSIVVVVVDTMRRDHASLYGYHRETTPHLDGLAARGVRFDNAYASSCWSVPSHASLFTGLLPHAHGATFEHMRLDDGPPTLASVLAANAYETAGFSANPYITTSTGMARGFSSYADLWRPFVMRRALVATQLATRLGHAPSNKGGDAVAESVRRWLATRDSTRPYLLFVNFMEAHAPYQDAPDARAFMDAGLPLGRAEAVGRESHDAQWMGTRVAPENIQTTIDLLDGATKSADRYLGEILEAVGPEPLVVVLSDHGDLVGEHGLFGHMTGLYEPLIRIPMVMAGPGLPSGAVVAAPASIIDVMPTLLAQARVPAPKTQGLDLSPAIAGAASDANRPLIAEHDRNPGLAAWAPNRPAVELARLRARQLAVVSGTKKRVAGDDGIDVGFDLVADPGEERPMPGTSVGITLPEVTTRAPQGDPVKLSPDEIEALRALGYVH